MKKMNNKGFSLVELIVVIAIMAILVGALAPQLLKYIEKSRQANDVQAAGSAYTVITTAYLDPDVTNKPQAAFSNSALPGSAAAGTFNGEIWEGLGSKSVELSSKAYKSDGIKFTLDSTGNILVVLKSTVSGVPDKTIDASGAH